MSGRPNPARQGKNSRVVCPRCGEPQGNLPFHLVACDAGDVGGLND
jgi:hypothetical protein